MRQQLEKNTQLNLKNNNLQKSFIIDNFVGEGASCLVYNAKYIDELGIIRNVRIKELYPIECSETRENNYIIWPNDDNKNYYIKQFESLYQRQIYFQNMVNFTNSSTQIIDNIYEANNTKYIILDCANGKTFDKYQPNHLQNIFEVLLSLTILVKKYHDQGYLMLDIKPENFLTIDETNQLIKYLDFDSIMSLYVLKNNQITGLSCSLRYAAPEVIRGDIRKIDKCSDIYSIGAVLFKKIYDQDVTSNERSIGFTPNYDNKYFTNINPKIYKKLTTFFRKTLCNHSKRRYQNCDEMIIDLEELIEISNPNSCGLVSSNIIQKNYFIGRDNESEEIDEAFNNGKKIVFINGYGGIGKTELVKYYANSRSNNYHTIIFGKCLNGLKEVFENEDVFTIRNLRKKEVTLEERINTIKQLVDEETLIVIDNLDVLNDPHFETLCSLNCKLLITTRANLKGIISNTDTTEIIEMKPLVLEDAYDLFTYYYQRDINEEEKQSIFELIKHIEGFTLMIPILAKQMILESILPSIMLNKLKNNKLKGISSSLIKHYKDNHIMNATAYNQALGLFDIFELTREEKEILYIMALLGNVSISKRTLALFAGQFDIGLFNIDNFKDDFVGEINKLKENVNVKTINTLIDKGYLDYDSTYDLVRCHNIIREISLYEFNYSLIDTTIFNQLFEIITDKLRMDYQERHKIEITFSNYVEHSCLESVVENELKQLCFNIFDNIDFSNIKNQDLISKYLLKMIIISEKDYSHIIKKYLKETNKMILYVCDWIQSLCLNISSENLIGKLDFIISFESNDSIIYLENMSLLFDEIAIYPYIWLLDMKLLSALKEQLLIYEDKSIDICDIKDFKSHRKLYKEIEYAINHNAHDDVIFDNIRSIRFIIDENQPKADEIITLKNITNISDCHYDKYEHKRSLHEVSDDCYKDIKKFEYKTTKDDIEIPLLLSILGRYRSHEDIERDQFVTYFGSFSAYNQINENIYEYLSRKNDYMFMSLQLKQFNILKNLNEIPNVQEYILHSYRLNTSVGKLLADEGETSVLLETLSIYLRKILTKENLEFDTNNIINFFGKTKNYSVNEFYNYCIEIGNKYHDSKLLQLIEKSKREIIGLELSYHAPELNVRNSYDYEVMWNRIEELYHQCIHVNDFDEINHLRDEIMVDPHVASFFKTKLLNCIHPKLSFFDSLFIDEKCICKKYSCDFNLLEILLKKERESFFEGIEEIINLFEICLQYNILKNMDKVFEYTSKIEKYIDENIVINNKFNYILYKIYHAYIKVLDKLGFDLCCKALVLNLYINCFETEQYRNDYAYDPTYYVDFENLLYLYDKYHREIDSKQENQFIGISNKINDMFDELFMVMDEKED